MPDKLGMFYYQNKGRITKTFWCFYYENTTGFPFVCSIEVSTQTTHKYMTHKQHKSL